VAKSKKKNTTTTTTKEKNMTETENKKAETKAEKKARLKRENERVEAAFVQDVASREGKALDYPATLPATPRIPFVQTLAKCHISTLSQTPNVRTQAEVEANAQDLMEDIKANGMLEPILVNVNPDVLQDGEPLSLDNPQRLKGDCRRRAIELGLEVYPEIFEEMFPGGMVPVYTVECNEQDAIDQINDHGEHRPLGHAIECKRMCWMMLLAGFSKQEIILSKSETLARFSTRVKSGKSKQWKEAQGYLEDASLTENEDKRVKLLEKANKARIGTFYGQLQDREREARLPWVMDAITYHEGGKVLPEDSPLHGASYIPTLTTGQVKELARAFDSDKGASRRNPGAKFKAKWGEIVKAQKDKDAGKGGGKSTSGRSKSASDLRSEAAKPGRSAGVQAILNYAANTGDADERKANLERLKEVDVLMGLVEDAIKFFPEAWNDLEANVKAARLEEEKKAVEEANAAANQVDAA